MQQVKRCGSELDRQREGERIRMQPRDDFSTGLGRLTRLFRPRALDRKCAQKWNWAWLRAGRRSVFV